MEDEQKSKQSPTDWNRFMFLFGGAIAMVGYIFVASRTPSPIVEKNAVRFEAGLQLVCPEHIVTKEKFTLRGDKKYFISKDEKIVIPNDAFCK